MFEKLRFLKNLVMKNFFDFSRQCKYLKLEKLSGIEIEMPIHKTLTVNLLKGLTGLKNPFFQK